MEKANFNYVKSMSDLELRVAHLTQSETDLHTKLEWAKRETVQANNELQQYRSRAQTTLQLKEKQIEELKLAIGGSPMSPTPSNHSIEQLAVVGEREAIADERRRVTDEMEQIRLYVEKLESGQREQRAEYERLIDGAIAEQRNAEVKCRQADAEAKVQQRELAVVREEMARLQADYAEQMHKK